MIDFLELSSTLLEPQSRCIQYCRQILLVSSQDYQLLRINSSCMVFRPQGSCDCLRRQLSQVADLVKAVGLRVKECFGLAIRQWQQALHMSVLQDLAVRMVHHLEASVYDLQIMFAR